jgi:hypothetical protein
MSSPHRDEEIPFWEVLAWTLGHSMDEPNGIALIVQTRQGPIALELDYEQASKIAQALREEIGSRQ